MKEVINYSKIAGPAHLKSFGQYFTDEEIASFMVSWACNGAKNVLDPAAGNSVFLKCAKELYPDCGRTGYEIDPVILDYFGNPAQAQIHMQDYLCSGWEDKYDAIVCNPPYHRFQSVAGRKEILDIIKAHTHETYSSYTNLYILFLIKGIYQMSEQGKLAFIIPTEFFNSRYGTAVKEKMIRERLLKAVIRFENDEELFFNATTTCCILFLDKEQKRDVQFYKISSMDVLQTMGENDYINVPYERLDASQKWRNFLNHEQDISYKNLVDVSVFCKAVRGIATGDNAYFCLSKSRADSFDIPQNCLLPCICRSADVKSVIFTEQDFELLENADKTVYVFDASEVNSDVQRYIVQGINLGVPQKYLPSKRRLWYMMERRDAAPIWVASACRNGMKFVRNITDVRTLTAFHSIYINEGFEAYTDILFCYFLTPTAQEILRDNRKEMGGGLEKFQPGDINTAKMLDLTKVSQEDQKTVLMIYEALNQNNYKESIRCLEEIFVKYLM